MLKSCITAFWNDILDKVNCTNKNLQNPKFDLEWLKKLVTSKRDCFNEYEKEGAQISGTTEYVTIRQPKRNVRLIPLDYGQSPEVQLTPSQTFRSQSFVPVIDQFISALKHRISAN